MDLKLKLVQELKLEQGLQNIQLLALKAEGEIAEEEEDAAAADLLAVEEASAAEAPGLEDVGDSDRSPGASEASLFDDPARADVPAVPPRVARLRLRYRIVRNAESDALEVQEMPGGRSLPAHGRQSAVAAALRQHLENEEKRGRRLEKLGDWKKIRPVGGEDELHKLAGDALKTARGAAPEVTRGFLLELPNGDVVHPDALMFPAGRSDAARSVTAAAVLAAQSGRPLPFRTALEAWSEAEWKKFRRTSAFDDARGSGKP